MRYFYELKPGNRILLWKQLLSWEPWHMRVLRAIRGLFN
jgi:hypothetical protein